MTQINSGMGRYIRIFVLVVLAQLFTAFVVFYLLLDLAVIVYRKIGEAQQRTAATSALIEEFLGSKLLVSFTNMDDSSFNSIGLGIQGLV